jgi:hypothetical protein
MNLIEIDRPAPMLATKSFSYRGAPHILTFYSIALPQPSDASPAVVGRIEHFLVILVDSPQGVGRRASILWRHYWFNDRLAMPPTRFHADAVWHSARSRVDIVTAEVAGDAAYWIGIYEVDPAMPLSDFPAPLDLDEAGTLRDVAPPVARIRTLSIGSIDRFTASITGDVIEIRGQPNEPVLVDDRPVNEFSLRLNYNIATGQWVDLHGSGR